MIYSNAETASLLEDILADDSKLSDWERDFINNVHDIPSEKMTPRQKNIIGRIHEEKYA